MSKNIQMPSFFHELFGTEQNKTEFGLILLFTLTATCLVAGFTNDYWMNLKWYQNLVLWLLFLDISGGVVANLSQGTNRYYKLRPRSRLVFIAIHLQPLLLAWVLQSPLQIALAVWAYTILSALLVNALRAKTYHRLLAGIFLAAGLMAFVTAKPVLPTPIAILYLLFMMKLIFSFAVDHEGVA